MSYDELVVNKKLNLNELQGLDRLQLELLLAYLLPAFETYTSKSIRAMEFYVLVLQLIEKEIFINLSIELNLMLVREANQLLEQLNSEHQKFINQCNEIFKSDHSNNLEKQRLIEEIIKLLQERIDFNNKLIAMYAEIIIKLERISKGLEVYIERKYKEIEEIDQRYLANYKSNKAHEFNLDNQTIVIYEKEVVERAVRKSSECQRKGILYTHNHNRSIIKDLMLEKFSEVSNRPIEEQKQIVVEALVSKETVGKVKALENCSAEAAQENMKEKEELIEEVRLAKEEKLKMNQEKVNYEKEKQLLIKKNNEMQNSLNALSEISQNNYSIPNINFEQNENLGLIDSRFASPTKSMSKIKDIFGAEEDNHYGLNSTANMLQTLGYSQVIETKNDLELCEKSDSSLFTSISDSYLSLFSRKTKNQELDDKTEDKVDVEVNEHQNKLKKS